MTTRAAVHAATIITIGAGDEEEVAPWLLAEETAKGNEKGHGRVKVSENA